MILQRDSPGNIPDSPQTDDSLSFCDLPISETREALRDFEFERRRRHTTPNEQEFEFFRSFDDLTVHMCSADDIFSHGKLLPYRSPTHRNSTTEGEIWNSLKKDFFQAKGRALKHGYSVEYQRLEKLRPKPSQTQMPKRVGCGDVLGPKASRPKWYLLMFGSMRAPAEMEMRDIRSRQRRRSPARVAPAEDGEGKRSWKLLRALSCRGHPNAVVGTPSELQSHV